MSSSLAIRVEVPSHSYSLSISLSPNATVHDLKRAIFEQCQGKPSVDGQRLITKGRVLQDDEVLESIWIEQDVKIVFLAVNPASWTSTPPAQTSTPSSASMSRTNSSHSMHRAPAASHFPNPITSQRPQSLSYVQYLHTNALLALQRAPLVNVPTWDIAAARDWSKLIVESYGYEWPKVLDEDFPGSLSTVYPPNSGVFYRSQYIHGYPYMSLSSKSTEPTPLQARALEILTCTFPLLSSTFQPIYYPTWISASQMFYPSSNLLIPAGSPNNAPPYPRFPVHNIHNNRIPQPPPRPQVPNFPFRAFAAPFIMLSLRTLFLLYIFSPARKPIFALAITIWLIWELWTAAQGVIAEERAAAQPQVPGAPRNNRNGVPPNGNARPNIQPPGAGNNQATANNGNRWNIQQVVNRLAEHNLQKEEAMMNSPQGAPNTRQPGLIARIIHCVTLFVLTIHPDVWNRRRRLLLEREGRIKREIAERRRQRENTENPPSQAAGQGEGSSNQHVGEQLPPPPPPTRPEVQERRREAWLESYIDRIERAQWVDG